MRTLAIGTVALAFFVATGTARAEPRPYRGPHPLDFDGAWHDEPAVHVHDDLPIGLEPFASIDGVMTFLGDPIAYGWQGDVWVYAGVHPLPARIGGFCGIEGEHRHEFAPEGEMRLERGAYVFVGALRGDAPLHVPGRVGLPIEIARERSRTAPGVVITHAPVWAYPYAPVVVYDGPCQPWADAYGVVHCRRPVEVRSPPPVRQEPRAVRVTPPRVVRGSAPPRPSSPARVTVRRR